MKSKNSMKSKKNVKSKKGMKYTHENNEKQNTFKTYTQAKISTHT